MRKAERINGEKDRIGAERGGVTSLRIGILDVECGPSRGPWLEFIAGLPASTEKLPLQISRRIDLPSIRVFLFFREESSFAKGNAEEEAMIDPSDWSYFPRLSHRSK